MAEKRSRNIIPGGSGFFGELSIRAKLVVRLFRDRRVSFFLKLLPVASLVYLVIPDIPFIFDDAAVLWLGTYLFVELCPPDVVQEHLNDLHRVVPGKFSDTTAADIVDGEFEDTSESEMRKEPGEKREEK